MFEALFAEATAATSSGPRGRQFLLEDVGAVVAARDALVAAALADAEPKIREASSTGWREVELLSFAGNATTPEGVSVLSLVAGPRDRGARQHWRMLGVTSVVEELRRAMRPFTVYHAWNPFTNANSLRVCW
jgi:hypothetical protein